MSKWITWNGGDMPVPKCTPIWVCHRDGYEVKTKAGGDCAIRWVHKDMNDDIIAYKLRNGWRFNEGTVPAYERVDVMFNDGSISHDTNVHTWGWGNTEGFPLWRPAKSQKQKASESAPQPLMLEGKPINIGDTMYNTQGDKSPIKVQEIEGEWVHGVNPEDGSESDSHIHYLSWTDQRDPYAKLRKAQDEGKLITFEGVPDSRWMNGRKPNWAFSWPVEDYRIVPDDLAAELRAALDKIKAL